MDRLPTLLVHGPTIWKLITIGFAVIVLAIVVAIRYLRARRANRRASRTITEDRSALRGVLRGGTGTLASTVAIEVYDISTATPTAAVASWRVPKLWLETADRKIALVGEVEVIAGTTYAGRRRKLPRLPAEGTDAVRDQLPWLKTGLRSAIVQTLRAGDEVAVIGVPQPHAGQGETSNREADIAWSLEGTGNSPLVLAAIRPVPARLSLGLVRIAIVLAVGVGVASFIKGTLGERWQRACSAVRWEQLDRQHRNADHPLALTDGHPCVLAASVSSDQMAVLENLHELIERHPYRDPETVRLLTELARETQSCQQRVQSLFYNGQFEATLVEARLCGDRAHEHEALVALGRIDEALAIENPMPPGDTLYNRLPALTTLIAGKRWAEAAERLDSFAEVAQHRVHAIEYQCKAELFRHHAGDAQALSRLQALVGDPDGRSCLGILAQIDPAAHTRWLVEHFDPGPTRRLHEASGREMFPPSSRFEDLLVHPEDRRDEAVWAWLAIEGSSPGMRILRLRQQATAAAFDNDDAAARRFADQAVALAASLDDEQRRDDVMYEFRDVPRLRRAVALYSGEVFAIEAPGRPTYDSRLYMRSSLPLDQVTFDRGQHLYDVFNEIKRDGDANKLLAHLRPLGIQWADGDLLAILPHLKTGRAALARELRYFPPHGGQTHDMFSNAIRAVLRRELFEQLGDSEQAAAWDAIYRRFDRLFEDRDVLVGLMLAES